jgi:hypothetical protein
MYEIESKAAESRGKYTPFFHPTGAVLEVLHTVGLFMKLLACSMSSVFQATRSSKSWSIR